MNDLCSYYFRMFTESEMCMYKEEFSAFTLIKYVKKLHIIFYTIYKKFKYSFVLLYTFKYSLNFKIVVHV